MCAGNNTCRGLNQLYQLALKLRQVDVDHFRITKMPTCCIVIPALADTIFLVVEEIRALGAAVSREFTMTQLVDNLLVPYAQHSFPLRTIPHHGSPTFALHIIFQATVISKLTRVAWMVETCLDCRSRPSGSVFPAVDSSGIHFLKTRQHGKTSQNIFRRMGLLKIQQGGC